jgi:hypothetical protein
MTVAEKLERTRKALIAKGFVPCENCQAMYRCAFREEKCEKEG